MTNTTSIKKTLKTLPLIGLLAMGLALVPATSIAGNGDRGHDRHYSKKSGKHYDKGHYRGGKHASRSHGKSHKGHLGKHMKHHSSARNPKHAYKGHHKHKHYKQHKHNHHYARHDHHYDHRGHDRYYVVNDYYPRDRYYGLDNLRFMIGLHTDNLDITFRD